MTEPHPSRAAKVEAEREDLLRQLKGLNAGLKRNHAQADITVKQARYLPVHDLRLVVEATGHRLAAIIKATQ